MLLSLPEDLLAAVVANLDLLDKCSLACTCRWLDSRAAAEWFRDEEMFLEYPLTGPDDGVTLAVPSPAWLRRYGLKVKVDIVSEDAEYEMDYLRGARVIHMQWGTQYGTPKPLPRRGGETLAAMFPELEYLNMTRNNGPMKTFEQLGKMVNLKSLALLTDSLAGKPDTLTRLTRLESLHYDVDVSVFNRDIPAFLGGMTRLTSLTLLYDNDIPEESSWDSLAPLAASLKDLGLVQFDITRLPPVLSQLTQLTKLVARREVVLDSEEPGYMEPDGADVLADIPRLQCLKMKQMKLKNMPLLPATLTELAVNNHGHGLGMWERLGALTQLKNLTLEEIIVDDLPPPVSGLTSLTRLNLTAMRVQPTATFPPNLDSLRLKATSLSCIPESVSTLTRLRHLFHDKHLVLGGWEHVPPSVTKLRMLRQDSMPEHLVSINDPLYFLSDADDYD